MKTMKVLNGKYEIINEPIWCDDYNSLFKRNNIEIINEHFSGVVKPSDPTRKVMRFEYINSKGEKRYVLSLVATGIDEWWDDLIICKEEIAKSDILAVYEALWNREFD